MFVKLTETVVSQQRNWIDYPAGQRAQCRSLGTAYLRDVPTPDGMVKAMANIQPNGVGGVQWRGIDGGESGGKLLVAFDYLFWGIDDLEKRLCPNCNLIKIKVNDNREMITHLPLSGFVSRRYIFIFYWLKKIWYNLLLLILTWLKHLYRMDLDTKWYLEKIPGGIRWISGKSPPISHHITLPAWLLGPGMITQSHQLHFLFPSEIYLNSLENRMRSPSMEWITDLLLILSSLHFFQPRLQQQLRSRLEIFTKKKECETFSEPQGTCIFHKFPHYMIRLVWVVYHLTYVNHNTFRWINGILL